MELKKFMKKTISPILAGTLILSSCNIKEVENQKNPVNSRIEYLIKKDKEFEPELEVKIEKAFGVNILGEKENLDNYSLSKTYDKLSEFDKSMSGLNIILGEIFSKETKRSGEYFHNTDFGSTIFDNNTNYQTLAHEIFHYLHYHLPQKTNFDEEWANIKTKVYLNGKISEMTTKEAISKLNGDSRSWKLIDKKGNTFKISGGLFGFVRPHGIYGKIHGAERFNVEDVATFSEIMEWNNGVISRPFIYWDTSFESSVYIQKIKLLEKYGFVDKNIAEKTIKNIGENSFIFSDIREEGEIWFSNLEKKILSDEVIPSCKKNDFSWGTEFKCKYITKSRELGEVYDEILETTTISKDNPNSTPLFKAKLSRSTDRVHYTGILMSYNSSYPEENGYLNETKVYLTNPEKREEYSQRFAELAKTLQQKQSSN